VKPTTPSQPEPNPKPAAVPKYGNVAASRKAHKAAQHVIEAAPLATMKKRRRLVHHRLRLRSLNPLPFHLLKSNRSKRSPISSKPPCLRVCGTDKAYPHSGTYSSFRGSAHAGCTENSCPLRSQLWLHSLGQKCEGTKSRLLERGWNSRQVAGGQSLRC
jgi:hypothetical protein